MNKEKVCAIHQPTFFPWLGFFHKLKNCDIFVFLNDAQMPKKEGSYMNRTQIISRGESFYITAPIKRPSQGVQRICDVEIVGNKFSRWREKFKKTLQVNYAKCKYYKEYRDFIFDLIDYPSFSLEDYNVNVIWMLARLLKIDNFFEKVRFSHFMKLKTTGTQRLIDITKHNGCDTYMSGKGGSDYMDMSAFGKGKIWLKHQRFEHPVYEQANTKHFVPGLSVIDYIFNVGVHDVAM